MSLLPGSDVTCSIVNDDIEPQLTLVKNVLNDHGGALTVADFPLLIDAGPATSGVAQPVLANTPITISETAIAGYAAAGGWSCTDASGITSGLPAAGAAAGVDVNLLPGADVTCSIVNDDIEPTLTLVKNVVNDNGGDKTIADFNLLIGANSAISGTAYPVAANAPIIISELDLVDYAEGTWSCVDANGLADPADLPTAGGFDGASVTLKPGSAVSCEITNNDLGIDLMIAKAVSNPTPNVGDVITFTLTVSNAGPDLATNATVNDVVLAGFTYVPGSIAGGTSSNDSDPTVGGLNWSLANVPVGSPVILSFDVTVNAP